MKRSILTKGPVFGAVLFIAAAAGAAEPGSPGLPVTNLVELLQATAKVPVNKVFELSPQWVGTVGQASLRGNEKLFSPTGPLDLRLTHAWVEAKSNVAPRVVIARARMAGGKLTYLPGEAARYVENLPTGEMISKATNYGELMAMFGEAEGATVGWGFYPDRRHWTVAWTRFGREVDGTLRYLNVSAAVSAPASRDPAEQEKTNAVVETMQIREGRMRPADPQSAAELAKFKTADEIFAKQQTPAAKPGPRYPPAVQALIAVREKPGDHQKNYIAALNQVRAKPDPELFRQLVTAMNEEDSKADGLLEDIFAMSDATGTLRAWQPEPHKLATRTVIDSLSLARTPAVFEETMILILIAQGGGNMDFTVPGGEGIVLTATKNADGYVKSYSGGDLPPAKLSSVISYCQQRFRNRYPELWRVARGG